MDITVSLKDALHERPDGPKGPSRTYPSSGQQLAAWERAKEAAMKAARQLENPAYTVKPLWTAQEYRTFDRLSAMVCSHIQSERDKGRLWLKNFIQKHGKEKCDMMLAEVRRRDEQEWFKDKSKTKGA